jgi:hypothetical protein
VPTGAWLLIGVGSALMIVTLLLVFIVPSRPRPRRLTPRRLMTLQQTAPSSRSPVGALLTGFSYLYAPLSYPHVHYSVAGRLEHAIARIDAVDPLDAPGRIGQAVQQMVDLVSSPEESPPPTEGAEPVVDLLDQPRNEEQL